MKNLKVFSSEVEAINFAKGFNREFKVMDHQLSAKDGDSRKGFYISIEVKNLAEYRDFPGCAVHL